MQAGPGPDIRGAHSGSLARAPADVRAPGLPCCPAPPSACLVHQFQDIIRLNTASSMFEFVNHRQRGKHTMSISQARYLGGPGFSVPQAHAAVLGGRRELLAREVLQVPAQPPTPAADGWAGAGWCPLTRSSHHSMPGQTPGPCARASALCRDGLRRRHTGASWLGPLILT